MKEQVLETAPRKIKHIQFSVLSPQEIVKNSQLVITHRDLFNENRAPMENGGTSDHDILCETCGERMAQCIGHFAYLKRIRSSKEPSARGKIEKAINALCKKTVDCPYCNAINGPVKKVAAIKIVHEKFKPKKAHEEQENFKTTFVNAVESMPELKAHLHKAQEDLNAMKVLELFKKISDEDCELLGLDPQNARPELFIWQRIPVPPVAIRPSIAQDNASTEDDLTVKLSEIVQTNTNIAAALSKGITISQLMPWRTFRFNECVCTPYNADFDGDEMNLHVPQTEEARVEAIELMGVKNNLVTPRNGDPIIAAIQDFITSSYLITKKDVFYNRAQFTQICSYMADADLHIDVPPPAIYKPIRLWTGKQIFNVLMRPNKSSSVLVNLESKGRSFEKSFSIGINDVQPGEILREKKDKLITDANKACDDLIERSKSGKLENQPGCNEEQTLEAHISGILSRVRDDAGQICMTELNKHNAPLIMATCGSKGSKINVSQMVACVGQQIISGSRIPDGFQDRSLPHFPKHSKTPAARGFVRNSFYSGLTPTEFLFHAISGREGLVDTAVKTAETEDLAIHYDMSVRNSSGGLVQFCYGDDGLDPAYLEDEVLPVDLKRNLQHTINIVPWGNDPGLLPYEIKEVTDLILDSDEFRKSCTQSYIESLQKFISQELIEKLVSLRQYYGLISADERPNDEYCDIDPNAIGSDSVKAIVDHKLKITERQLRKFLSICLQKFVKAKIEPGSSYFICLILNLNEFCCVKLRNNSFVGTAVGALGAQSIGEPGTQMTLKTFHFAGVASMNITLGVPRIKEIINASKTISTPIITCKLVNDSDVKSARIVKGRLETTYLGDIAKYIDEIYERDSCYLAIKLDLDAIQKLQLETSIKEIARAIVNDRKLKLEIQGIRIVDNDEIDVYVPERDSSRRQELDRLYFRLQVLKRSLPKVIIKGIQTVTRAVISEAKAGKKQLLVEGYGLREVMTTEGIFGTETTSNNVNEGEVLGIHRFGISNMKSSVLMLASFEKTTDHLFDAALHSKRDCLEGVSESIIMGMPMQLGTGLFKLIRKSHLVRQSGPPEVRLHDRR
ncbi:17381_t:CDS:10 [Racocetra fulgida]|uniref:DNA-directed RNA polymerase subunit n=1 Tax=Racocetra fulgida TaxID=60492 RepID=A0A9N8Z6K2_9GLOM|nr:17381_t:CDS:10 [Racocetra fulgida]